MDIICYGLLGLALLIVLVGSAGKLYAKRKLQEIDGVCEMLVEDPYQEDLIGF